MQYEMPKTQELRDSCRRSKEFDRRIRNSSAASQNNNNSNTNVPGNTDNNTSVLNNRRNTTAATNNSTSDTHDNPPNDHAISPRTPANRTNNPQVPDYQCLDLQTQNPIRASRTALKREQITQDIVSLPQTKTP